MKPPVVVPQTLIQVQRFGKGSDTGWLRVKPLSAHLILEKVSFLLPCVSQVACTEITFFLMISHQNEQHGILATKQIKKNNYIVNHNYYSYIYTLYLECDI